jgi:SAM-dependent methyltransferase
MNSFSKLTKQEQEILNMGYPEFRKKYREFQLSSGSKIVKNLSNGLSVVKVGHRNYRIAFTDTLYSLIWYDGRTLSEAIKIANDPNAIQQLLNEEGIKNLNDKQGIENAIRKHYTEGIKHIKNNIKYNFREYRGRKSLKNQRILDVGAGLKPDFRATDAIGLHGFKKSEIKFENIKYITGYDLNKQNFPYKNNTFDVIISYGALGINFGNSLTYSEVYRILKPNGMLEIGVHPQNKPAIRVCKSMFKDFNYKNIKYTEFKDSFGEIYGRVEGTKP